MKKLVFEQTQQLDQYNLTANQLIEGLNLVLHRFETSHNHFGQKIDEAFAFQLVTDPVETFDGLLRANSPIKPVGGKDLDIVKLSELTGIDREGFIKDFTIVLPGTIDQYNKAGRTGLLRLAETIKPLVLWENGVFVLNTPELEARCEQFRVYANSNDQLALVEHWETLANILNLHKDIVHLDVIDCNKIAFMISLEFENKQFKPKYKALADNIRRLEMN